jgi:VanZ family protein
VARTLAWVGILAIIILSVVPTVDRPSTGAGQLIEHFAAFALVAGVFAVGYRFSLMRLLLLAFFFCGGIELLQVPLPTRHARVSDFVIDLVGSYLAIGFVFAGEKLISAHRRHN